MPMILRTTQQRRLCRARIALSLLTLSCLMLTSCAAAGGGGGADTQSSADVDANGAVFKVGSTMATIQSRGKLIVGIRSDIPPFASHDSNTGSLDGFDVAMVKLIAQNIFGRAIENRIQYIELDPRDFELSLENNKVDIVVGHYGITVARKRFVDFAGPYYVSNQNILYSTDINSTPALLDFNAGAKLCTVRGSTDLDAVHATLPGADSSMLLDTVNACIAQLQQKKVNGVVADQLDLNAALSQSSTFSLVATGFGTSPYGIGVHKGTTDLREYINNLLTTGPIGQNWSTLVGQYLGSGASQSQPSVDRY